MSGSDEKIANVSIGEDNTGVIFTDGSRREGHTAAATTKDTWYLVELATVMDAEISGIAIGWFRAQKVAADSQGASHVG